MSGLFTSERVVPLRPERVLGIVDDHHREEAERSRITIPYGTLSVRQLMALAEIAERHGEGRARFTARQDVRFEAASPAAAPAILAALAEVGLGPLAAEGGDLHVVTTDPHAGAAHGEVEDPRPWCALVRRWLAVQPALARLPRGLRIMVTASPLPAGTAMRSQDLVLVLKRDEAGTLGFTALLGGTSGAGGTIRAFLPADELLAYAAALVRVYDRFTRWGRDHKARIRILAHELGAAGFARLVEAEHAAGEPVGNPAPWAEELARSRDRFAPPPWEALADVDALHDQRVLAVEAFGRWVWHSTARHKVPGYSIVTVPLQPAGGVPGEATAEAMRALAELAEEFGHGELRVTRARSLVLPHVRKRDLFAIWHLLDDVGLASLDRGPMAETVRRRELPSA
ncbi:hypothetical protein [Benzoatithermus flavus]|uniref:Nitrite/sulfite reductase n=1 Tax=Benzoatithermus flavus TaxID=3108223 RepID=A0ABU8XTC7_9PROT